ncbi:hypothetical protein [Shewanella sp. AC91-MNA-CIBAN-0169]|jgi:hypothetical protein|uniref:hypothetical protein n=1 Tax=Shewanella TaxID=22 RepID=UPI00332800C5
MSNPKATENLKRFEDFVNQRVKESDWEDYVLPNRLDLNKKMIARDCEFDRKRITENSKIKAIYDYVKIELINKGILLADNREPSVQYAKSTESAAQSKNKSTLKKSQEINAALEEQLSQAKKDLLKAEEKLIKLKTIEDYMLATGRL